MKFNIELQELLKVMGKALGVVEARNTIPILSNIKMETVSEGVKVTSTDLDIQFQSVVNAEVEKTGVTTIPSSLFNTLKKMPLGSIVYFEIKDTTAHIKCGRSKISVPTIDAEDFPIIHGLDGEPSFKMAGAEFADLLSSVAVCMSTEETRYSLNGVYLHSDGGNILSAATDGHRLAECIAENVNPAPFKGVIIPRKTVMQIIHNFNEGDVSVWISDQKIAIQRGDDYVVSKLIDATYPEYKRVIPTDNDIMCHVDGGIMSTVVDRVASVCQEKTKAIKLVFNGSSIGISTGAGANTAEDVVDAEYNGDLLTIGFNASLLNQLIAAAGKKSMEIKLKDDASPAIFTPKDGRNKLFLLMPMRVT